MARELIPSRHLLGTLLDQPGLVEAVRALEPSALRALVDHLGLEDSGEILALASREQLAEVLDQDLWHQARPGQDERFDGARFSLWLEVLREAGPAEAARRLLDLDPDFITLALSRQVLVVNLEDMARHFSARHHRDLDDDELALKALESSLGQDFDEHAVLALEPEGWDALVDILLAMDAEDHAAFQGLLERLAHVSESRIEEGGGLHRVLTAREQLESDVADAREERREAQGYISPANARAFLRLARLTAREDILARTAPDPITRACFRVPAPAPRAPRPPPGPVVVNLEELLRDAEVIPRAEHLPLLGPGAAHRALKLRTALEQVARTDPARHARSLAELGYLANILVAGCTHAGRALRPVEAADAVIRTCNLGMEDMAVDALDGSLVQVFRLGWNAVYHQVTVPAARAVLARMQQRRQGPAAARLERNLDAQQPWASRKDLEGMEWDLPVLAVLRGAVDECPALPRTLLDPKDARPGMEFLSSVQDVRRFRQFLSRLPRP